MGGLLLPDRFSFTAEFCAKWHTVTTASSTKILSCDFIGASNCGRKEEASGKKREEIGELKKREERRLPVTVVVHVCGVVESP